MLDELPALIAAGYADVAEEDVVRLKWWGLYHDKPKVGTFMLRVKLAAGRLTTPQLRAIGRLALEHGKGEAELTTRQNVQLHNLGLDALPQVFEELHAAALTSLGGCGDTVRAITGCPAVGIAHDELFDVTPRARRGAPLLHGEPRLRRPAAQAQDLDLGMRVALQRAGDQLHLARRRPARRRAGLLRLVGGGLSSVPRIARDLGVFVRAGRGDRGAPRDPRHLARRPPLARVARQVRMKFMVDALGPEGVRAEVERGSGTRCRRSRFRRSMSNRTITSASAPNPTAARASACPSTSACSAARASSRSQTCSSRSARRRGSRGSRTCCSRTSPPPTSTPSWRRSAARAAARARRSSRQRDRLHRRAALQLLGDRDEVAARCADRRARRAVRRGRLAAAAAPRRMPPRVRAALGRRHRLPGDDRPRRGRAARPGVRRLPPRRARAARGDRASGVPARADAELDELVHGLVGGWLANRADGESLRAFLDRTTDDELGLLAGREPARSRREEAAA